jgi:hypothetical protein
VKSKKIRPQTGAEIRTDMRGNGLLTQSREYAFETGSDYMRKRNRSKSRIAEHAAATRMTTGWNDAIARTYQDSSNECQACSEQYG